MQPITKFFEDHHCWNKNATATKPGGNQDLAVIKFQYCDDATIGYKILPNTVEILHRGIHGQPNNPCDEKATPCDQLIEKKHDVLPPKVHGKGKQFLTR